MAEEKEWRKQERAERRAQFKKEGKLLHDTFCITV